MRVLTICGSWNPTSANAALLDVATARWQATGHDVAAAASLQLIDPFDPMLVDAAPAAVAALRAQIEASDAVAIAAPEYAGALAGVVKNTLDWMVGSGSLWDRAVGIAAAGTTGGWFARRDVVQTLSWQGALVVAHLGIAAPRTKTDDTGRFVDAVTLADIERFADDMVEHAGRDRAARIRRAREIAVEFDLDPSRVAGGVDG